jgi:hypothetical protein
MHKVGRPLEIGLSGFTIGQEGKSCAYLFQAVARARKGLLRWWGSAFCNTQNHHNHGSTLKKRVR